MFQDGSPGPQPNEPRTERRSETPILSPRPERDFGSSRRRTPREGDRRFRDGATSVPSTSSRSRPSSATVNDGRKTQSFAAERPGRTPARPRGFFSFGRFRVLFDSLFRVLFNFPSRYLFAVGLAVGVEPRMGRTTRLRAAFSNDPTLEPTRRFDLAARARCGPDTLAGPDPIGESCARSPLGLLRLPPVLAPHVDGRPLGRPDSALGSVRFSTIVVSLHSPLLRKPQLVSFSTA